MARSRVIPGVGVTPQALERLATLAREALGSGDGGVTASAIIAHAVEHACFELEYVEKTLGVDQNLLAVVLAGIRSRLECAIDNAHTIATIVKEAEASR